MVKQKGAFVNCDYCGKVIWRENNQLRNRKNNFCSRGCWIEFQKQPIVYEIFNNEYAIFYLMDKFNNKHKCFIDIEDLHLLNHSYSIVFGANDKTFWIQDYHGKKLNCMILQADKNLCVDHINHNTLDNRKKNLRLCSKGENNQNKKNNYTKSNTGYRNVYFKKSCNKYFVKVTVNRIPHFRGYFEYSAGGLQTAIDTAKVLRKQFMPFSTE